jgi:hypothetical protein
MAQVVRGTRAADCHTHCQGRDTGDPYTFASSMFHLDFTFSLSVVAGVLRLSREVCGSMDSVLT